MVKVTKEVVEQATESKTAEAVLNTSLQFSKSLDKVNENRIGDVERYTEEITDLKVENTILKNQVENLRVESDKILIGNAGPFGSTTFIKRDLNDSRVKDLLDKSLTDEIKQLKEEVLLKKANLEILEKENKNLNFQSKMKYLDVSEKEERLVRNYEEKLRKEKLEISKFKQAYEAEINNLRTVTSIANKALTRFKNQVNTSWLLRVFNKNLNELKTLLDNIDVVAYRV